jgi:type II secretory pathway pseudopilin PulG
MQSRLGHQGLTMVETIIVTVVLAIMVGLATPPFVDFLNKYRERLELEQLLEIQKALENFAKTYNRLPDSDPLNNTYCNVGSNTWYECLATVSGLSASQILNDTWDRPRAYVFYSRTEPLFDVSVDVTYASVHSMGVNLEAEDLDGTGTAIEGLAVSSGGSFEAPTHADWWANDGDPVGEFQTLQPGGDDHFIKFSDLMLKVEKYHVTAARMSRISQALETYASVKQEEEYISGNPNPELLIYAPPSVQVIQPHSMALYAGRVRNDLAVYGVTAVENRNGSATEKAQRLNDMLALVRMLGLSDEHCCDALKKEADISATQDRPLFYYSNPRANVGGVCQNRATTIPFMPPEINSEPNLCE